MHSIWAREHGIRSVELHSKRHIPPSSLASSPLPPWRSTNSSHPCTTISSASCCCSCPCRRSHRCVHCSCSTWRRPCSRSGCCRRRPLWRRPPHTPIRLVVRVVVVHRRVVVRVVVWLVVHAVDVLLVVARVVGGGVPAVVVSPTATVVPAVAVLLLALLADVVVVVPGQIIVW